jgi:hypothetical protein
MTSSTETEEPTDFPHEAIAPSEMLSPNCGTFIVITPQLILE